MKLTRQLRFLTALIALVGLLFAQLAVAGYACPSYQTGMTSESATMLASSDDQDMQDMPGCGQMDQSLPSLCHAQAQTGSQSLDKPQLPQLPPFSAAALAFVVSPVAVSDVSIDNPPQSSPLLARITAPPLSIRHCCFRI